MFPLLYSYFLTTHYIMVLTFVRASHSSSHSFLSRGVGYSWCIFCLLFFKLKLGTHYFQPALWECDARFILLFTHFQIDYKATCSKILKTNGSCTNVRIMCEQVSVIAKQFSNCANYGLYLLLVSYVFVTAGFL